MLPPNKPLGLKPTETHVSAVGFGCYSSPNSMARCRVLQSNPAGAPVAWGAAMAEPTITITPTSAAHLIVAVGGVKSVTKCK